MKRNPGRNVTLRRLLSLARRLGGRKIRPDLSRLAEEYDVCERTIRRDLEVLRETGWNVPRKDFNP